MGVWIEIERGLAERRKAESLPAWECGLKSHAVEKSVTTTGSLPAWECGLKFYHAHIHVTIHDVTPCVGVWIEIQHVLHASSDTVSLPAWECGLKFDGVAVTFEGECHSLRGSVD